jgi:hypothetical protein
VSSQYGGGGGVCNAVTSPLAHASLRGSSPRSDLTYPEYLVAYKRQ